MLCIPELVTDAYACTVLLRWNGVDGSRRRRGHLAFGVTPLCDVGSCRVLGCTSYSMDSKASKSLLVGQLIKVSVAKKNS